MMSSVVMDSMVMDLCHGFTFYFQGFMRAELLRFTRFSRMVFIRTHITLVELSRAND